MSVRNVTLSKPKNPRSFIEPRGIEKRFAEKLEESELTLAHAEALGMCLLSGQEVAKLKLWGSLQSPALAIRYFDPLTGKPMWDDNGRQFTRYRCLREPANKSKNFAKYKQLKGSGVHAYFPRLETLDWCAIFSDPSQTLLITEGELKAAKACIEGFPAIGLGGVWNFRAAKNGVMFLPELDAINWQGRRVIIIFDNDSSPKKQVAEARRSLAAQIKLRGGLPHFVDLPADPDHPGEKVGLDDFLKKHGCDALERLLIDAKPIECDEVSDVVEVVNEFNKNYMVVSEAGKTVIYKPDVDSILKRRSFVRLTFDDFEKLYLNRTIRTGQTEKGIPIFKNAAKLWLSHRDRRQFIGGVVFDPSGDSSRPDVLNLWQGFNVEPKPGDWSLMRDHIRAILCGGHEDHVAYLMGWIARMVQHPDKQGEVAIVMKGGEGTGKGTLARALMHIFGQHALTISNSNHLVGNFNAHLRDCVFLFADEAFFAGDKAHVGVLKSLITEPYLTIEAKHQNAVQMRNHLHLMMASNEEWVVPASLDSRRVCVLNVSDAKKGSHAYFGAIWEQMASGGYEAMLYDLLVYDLTNFDVRAVPQTEGLQDQRKLSLQVPELWWMDCLEIGFISGDLWPKEMETGLLFGSYIKFAEEKRERRPLSREFFGRFMRKMGYLHRRMSGDNKEPDPKRPYGYVLGDLSAARETFTKATGLSGVWGTEPEPEK